MLVEADELTISEFDYGPGERGAEPHVHREHADGFLVVDGEFTFHLRDGSRTLPAGTLLVIPPGVVHGFDNDGERACTLLQLPHAVARVRRLHAWPEPRTSTSSSPPEDGGVDPASVVVARLAE